MTNILSVLTLALGTTVLFGADVNAGASTPKNTAEKLLTESRAARQTATQLAEQLKRKDADLSRVGEHVASVEQNAAKIHGLLAELEGSGASFNARQRAALDQTKQLAVLMNVFLDVKKAMVADGTGADEREQLRSQALSVAKRAELIEKNVVKMGL